MPICSDCVLIIIQGAVCVKRILMVGPVPPPSGGIAAVMQNILVSRLSEEYLFDVFDKSDLGQTQPAGLLRRNYARIRRWIAFYGTLIRGDYAFVHMQGSTWAFRGVVIYMAIARLAGTKILLHLHGTDWNWFYGDVSFARRWMTRVGLRLPERIIVLYGEWAVKILELVPATHVTVIQNWMTEDQLPAIKNDVETRRTFDLLPGDFIVCSVGTVGWRKGTLEILKAVPDVALSIDSVRFVFAGAEEFPEVWGEVMKMVEDNALERWVRFPGELDRDSVISLLSISHIFLLPSFAEGMPIAIIEAMKMGVPIISTPVGGIPEMVENEVSAILIPPGSPRDIADSVLRLHRDPDLRARLSKAAMMTLEERFDAAHAVDALAKIYSEMTESQCDSATEGISQA